MSMMDHPAQPAGRGGGGGLGKLLMEALLVAAAGVGFAFLANQISPRGLKLTRNYSTTPASQTSGQSLEDRLKAQGLHLIKRPEVEQLFHDPRREQNAILFIDARGEDDYQKGHIPGACEFDPYYPEKYLPTALPPCEIADQIVVYCTGGDCEDSQAAAVYLRDAAGIPGDKLLVYGGGMTEWETNGLAVEIGARNSGDIHEGGK
jgi:rhodanese-related sulfurtransferase